MEKQYHERVKSNQWKPTVLVDYTENGMGNVDTPNHNLLHAEAKHKHASWRSKTHLLTLFKFILVNSSSLFSLLETPRKFHKHSKYIRELVDEIKKQLIMKKQTLKKQIRIERNQRYKKSQMKRKSKNNAADCKLFSQNQSK